jgi:hypothetical protein
MSKFPKVLGIAILALVTSVGAAQAQSHGGTRHGGGGWHGKSWHGGSRYGGRRYWGGWGWGGLGWGWGPYTGFAWGPDDYYGPNGCGWVRERVWSNRHYVVRDVWRCW